MRLTAKEYTQRLRARYKAAGLCRCSRETLPDRKQCKTCKSKDELRKLKNVADLLVAYQGPDAEFIEAPRVFEIIGRSGYWLTRGFHRVETMARSQKTRCEFEVKSGTFGDAVMDAATGNVGHGLKMTPADKRRCITMVIEACPTLSDRAIADKCGVSASLVIEVRAEVLDNTPEPEKTPRNKQKRVGRDGKEYPVVKNKPPEDPKSKIYTKSDGIPDLPGVYTPRYMKTAEGHEVALDCHDNPAPDRVGDIFADHHIRQHVADAVEVSEKFESFYQTMMKLTRSPNFPFIDIPKLQLLSKRMRDAMVEVTDHLREAVPTLVCPECSGAGGKCKPCRMSGYLSKGMYDHHPEYHGRKRTA